MRLLLIFLLFITSAKCQFNFSAVTNFEAAKVDGWILEWSLPYLQMFDASTKIPNVLTLYDLGNFDECYRIKTNNFYGKYCLGSLSPSLLINAAVYNVTQKINALRPLTLREAQTEERFPIHYGFAHCFPSYMSAEDIDKYTISTITPKLCYSQADQLELSGAAIATICFFSVILAIAVVQTAYDIFLHYTQQKAIHEVLLAFSFLSNGKQLFASSNNPNQLLCLNGIRAFSMVWVVVYHTFTSVFLAPLANILDIIPWINDVASMYVLVAPLAVDTFLLASGLVLTYTFLKSIDKKAKFNIFIHFVHRYLRLTPAFAAVVLIYRNLLVHITEKAPLWGMMKESLVDACQSDWWLSLIYLENIFDQQICVSHGWYLSVDMQLFVLATFVLLLFYTKWKKQALYLIYFLILAGIAIPFGVVYGRKVGNVNNDSHYLFRYYYQTYTRFGPYVIGMLFGYFIYELKKRKLGVKIPKIYVCGLWALCLAVLVTCVYGTHDLNGYDPVDRLSNAFYLALNRNAWAASVGVIIYLCVSGYGGPVDQFLSLHIFQFISKLSYSIYLTHYAIIIVRYTQLKVPLYHSAWNLNHLFWGHFMFSLMFSIPFHLLFEAPVAILEKFIFKR